MQILAPYKIGAHNNELYSAVILGVYPFNRWGCEAILIQFTEKRGWRLNDNEDAYRLIQNSGTQDLNKTGLAWTLTKDYGIELAKPLYRDLLSALYSAAKEGIVIPHDDFKRILKEHLERNKL